MKNQRLAKELTDEIRQFMASKGSLMLAVVAPNGAPIASYSPFVEYDGSLFILVSELAHHTPALHSSKAASVLLIDDEQDSETVYARRRLQYDMSVMAIPRDNPQWQVVSAALLARHGDIVSQLLQLGDFHLFQLSPQAGRFVKGFGRAYELAANTLVGDQLELIGKTKNKTVDQPSG